jgi:hypothetical protein
MEIVYYHDDVRKFIIELEEKVKKKTLRTIAMLEKESYHLSMPFSKRIEKD